MTRRKDSPPTCAHPGCKQPRYWDTRLQTWRGRYCRWHNRLKNRVAGAAPSRPYSPAEVLAAWDQHPYGSEFTYGGQIVYGLLQLADGSYSAVLCGGDAPVRLDAGADLRRLG